MVQQCCEPYTLALSAARRAATQDTRGIPVRPVLPRQQIHRPGDRWHCLLRVLSWLMSQGYGLSEIAQEMSLGDSGTLAQLRSNALPAFLAAVRNLPRG
jgi:hypothetical protein